MVKAKGSWVTLDTPAQKPRVPPPPPPLLTTTQKLLLVCLVGYFASFKNNFLFVRTDLSHCISLKAVVNVSYETTLLFQCGTTCLYILHIKYIKIVSLLRPFSGLIQKISQPINMFHQGHWGFLSPCYLYNQETKM